MKKQIAQGFAMLMLIAGLALVTNVVSANGQTAQTRTTIPFDFIVGHQTLAAGDYDVAAITNEGDCLRIRNTAAKGLAATVTLSLSGESKGAKLVFHRYGQTTFLAEVWTAGGTIGRQLLKSRQELAMEKELARIASLNGPPLSDTFEKIEIAMVRN